MEWSFIVAAVRRRVSLVIVCAVVGALPGLYKTLTADPTWEATAVISVATPTSGAGAATAMYQPDRYIASQLSVVSSRMTLESAAATLGGDWTPEAIGSLISVEQEPETDILYVRAEAFDPDVAAEVANTVATTYIEDALKRNVEARQPEIDALNAKLADLEKQLQAVNETIVSAMREQIQQARSSSNGVLPQAADIVPNELQRQAALQTEYQRVLSARSDIELGVSNQSPSVLIERATPPDAPKGGMGSLIMVGGAIFGALAGTAIALVLAQLSSKVLDERSAGEVLDAHVVGVIPRTRAYAESPIAAFEEAAPEIRETIERVSVRAEALASPEVSDSLVIAVVGTQPGAGTTTLTLALANRFVTAGYEVVIVDGDLRTQTISEQFDVDQNAGISAVLRAAAAKATPTSKVRMARFFTATSEDNAWVLGIGDIDRSAALRRDALGPILEAAKSKGKIVLYDGGAIGASALSVFAAKTADVVVLAVPIQDQDLEELREVANLLPEDRSRVLVVATSPVRRRPRTERRERPPAQRTEDPRPAALGRLIKTASLTDDD